jgi:hypothetical protein
MKRRRGRAWFPAGLAAALVLGAVAAVADPVDLTPLPDSPRSASPPATAPPAPSPPPPAGGFIFAESDRRELTAKEIAGLPCDRLVLARNEIFARHGRYFQREDLTRYFSQFAWYKPHTWRVTLTPVELENVRLLTEAGHHC